jgi:hypothetical protein
LGRCWHSRSLLLASSKRPYARRLDTWTTCDRVPVGVRMRRSSYCADWWRPGEVLAPGCNKWKAVGVLVQRLTHGGRVGAHAPRQRLANSVCVQVRPLKACCTPWCACTQAALVWLLREGSELCGCWGEQQMDEGCGSAQQPAAPLQARRQLPPRDTGLAFQLGPCRGV